MKNAIYFLPALLISSSAIASQPDPLATESRMAIKAFATELKGKLQTAMKAGGIFYVTIPQ